MLVILIAYFCYQSTFTWYNAEGKSEVKKDKVLFVTITEHRFGSKGSGMDSIDNKLSNYSFDEDKEIVKLKNEVQLPKKGKTKVVVIYDRGFESFEKHSEVLPISDFPFQYSLNDQPYFNVQNVDEDGNVYFTFKDKKVKVNLHKTYTDISINERVVIKNHGYYKLDQFQLMEKKKKKAE